MIRVTIKQTKAKEIASFTIEGHANFSEYGSDLVCAGVSAVAFGTLNAIVELTKVVPNVKQGGEGGYLHCTLPKDLPDEVKDKIQLLVKGMIVSLQTIEKDYGKYIQITFKQ